VAYQQHGHESATLDRIRHWLHLDTAHLQDQEKQALHLALQHSARLQTLYLLKQELSAIWTRSAETQEQLLKSLEDWCHRAETSGIQALQEFSYRLRCYRMA
jgi:stearoyl-CoA desaturase (delta-9 desaturase)